MTTSSDLTESSAATVRQYLKLVAAGSIDAILELFAEDASVEDPVGSAPRVGTEEIRGLFASLGSLERETELLSLRVCGHEAAFQFAITIDAGDGPMRLEPIDTMTFDRHGKITSVRSYFTAADITRL